MLPFIITGIIIIAGGCFYYRILLRRICSLFTGSPAKPMRILINITAVILSILSINIFSTAGIILLHILILSLAAEPLNLLLKKKNFKTWNFIHKACIIPVIATAVIFTFGYMNIRNVVRTEYSIKTEKHLHKDLKILMIADAHYGTIFNKDKLNELIPEFNAENPDIVVLVGDITDESTSKEEMEYVFRTLGTINSKYGIYFVFGNHDEQPYSSSRTYTPQELRTAITQSGITILEDKCLRLNRNLIIAGRKDLSTERISANELLYGVDQESFILLLDHQPSDYSNAEESGADLILSGHTHAGQIFPAGYFIKLFKTSELYYGYEQVNDMQAIVSSGVAGWGYPIRTQKNSEYVIINIDSSSSNF